MSDTDRQRVTLFCDCCGKEKLGELVDGKLIIIDRRHGKRHIFSERIDSLARFVLQGRGLELKETKAIQQKGA